MNEILNMTGNVVVVTGGTKGVGRGIVERFDSAGAHVITCGRTAPESLPGNAQYVEADVRDIAQIDAVVAFAVEEFGRLDVLVNNAGGSPYAEAAEASPRLSEKIIALNLTAPLHFCQRAHAQMVEQDGGGSIINIASVSGTRASPGTAAYGAAKAGLINLTKTLAVEWAPDVRVNAIVAGLIRTEQVHLHYGDDAGIARVEATVPMGRMGTPGDVGDACLFLASPLSSYMTGASLELHGGNEWPAFLRAAQGKS